jgi:hypothetical protein
MVRGVATIDRHRIMARFERGAVARTAAYNVGVAAATAAAAGGPALAATGSRLAAAGWALIGLVVIAQIMMGLWPITPRRPLAP